jgi:two-component system, NarL family, invasion response regulator UvrY
VIRVLLIDDHDLVRLGIKRLLSDTPGLEVIGEGSSGQFSAFFKTKCDFDGY